MKTKSILALVVVAAASILSSCKSDSSLPTGPQSVLPLKSSPPPANPAITYVADILSHRYTYYTIGVMDTTGANTTNIVTAASSNLTETFGNSSWSPTGSSILFGDWNSGGDSYFKEVDVSVSNGVPVGTNLRTIYTVQPSDSMSIGQPAWCATSSTGKIAFVRTHLDNADFSLSDLCIMSQSGGTPTVLTQDTGTEMQNGHRIIRVHYGCPTWSPDDSKIAFVRHDTNGVPNGVSIESTILIVNASTGARLDSIQTTMVVSRLEWSRSGTNELAFTASSGSAYTLYYVAPTTGSTISGNGVGIGNGPTWSPNNSSILGSETSVGLIKLIPYTSTQTTVSTNGGGAWLNWKR